VRRPALVATVVLVVATVAGLVVALDGHLGDTTPPTTSATTPAGPLPTASSGEVTVVGLGDSVMAGSHCDCSGVTAQYAAALTSRVHRKVRDVNLGVNGDTTNTLQQRLDTSAVTRDDLRRADLVLVIEGANDLSPQLESWRVGSCEESCFLPAVDAMGKRLTTALATIRELVPAQAQMIVAGYWNVFPDGEAARAEGGQAEIDWSREITRAANVAIQRAASPEHATYVDLTNSFLDDDSGDPTGLLAADGDHPNAAGERVIVADLLRVTRTIAS
jgi:lysophospholipase L1-like esterase